MTNNTKQAKIGLIDKIRHSVSGKFGANLLLPRSDNRDYLDGYNDALYWVESKLDNLKKEIGEE